MFNLRKTSVIFQIAALAVCSNTFAEEAPEKEHTLTGNMSAVSKYVYRGITQTYGVNKGVAADGTINGPESDRPALQGGIDYNHSKSGFYAGYWFSTLNYSVKDSTNFESKSIENDLYAGFTGEFKNGIEWTAGAIMYYFDPGWHSTAYQSVLGLKYDSIGITMESMLNSVSFANKGDTYFELSYDKKLPKNFTFVGTVAGSHFRTKSKIVDDQVLLESNPIDDNGVEHHTKKWAFSGATLGITHPITSENFKWGLTYIIGGDNRYGISQKNVLVASVNATF